MADKDFSPREMEIMAKAWNCMTEEPKVNYEKLAEACGMGNPRSASNAWRSIKAKIMAKGTGGITKGDDGEENGESPAKKATPRKRGKAAEKNAEDGESPTKKAKGGRKGKANVKKEGSAEADGGAEDDAAIEKVKQEVEVDGEGLN